MDVQIDIWINKQIDGCTDRYGYIITKFKNIQIICKKQNCIVDGLMEYMVVRYNKDALRGKYTKKDNSCPKERKSKL